MRPRLLPAALLALLLPSAAPALDSEAAERWRDDLDAARARILANHPDPFVHLTRAQLDERFAELDDRLEQLAPHEVVVALAEIVAALGDGHSRLTLPLPDDSDFVQGHSPTPQPEDPALRFHTLPVRFGLYDDGLFVERIEARHADLAGARVVAIGGVPVDEAMDRVAPVVRHDNLEQLLDLLPMHLALPEILAARGLAADRGAARFGLVTPTGERREVELTASPSESAVRWVSALDGRPRQALSLRHVLPGRAPRRGQFERENWWQRVPGSRALYVQYDRVEDLEDLPVDRLADEIHRQLASGEIDRLVLDLRWNWGGDHSLDLTLLHALIASPALDRPAGLVVLIGRGTFSAAMMLADDLEQHLKPLFVGEPTGTSPNHFGDSRKFRLPESGLTLRISTLWHQLAGPRDRRRAISPHLAVPTLWSDLLAGRDRVLEVALAPPAPIGEATGSWHGLLSINGQELPVDLELAAEDAGSIRGRLDIEGLGQPLELAALDAPDDRLRFGAESPLGDLELELVRLGDRLAGRVTFARRPWRHFAIGLAPGGG